jgi:competence protein ComEC
MVALVAAFLAGICLFQLQTTLPAAGWVGAAPLLAAAAWRYPALRLPAAVCVGFCWALAWVSCCAPPAYQSAWDERDLSAEGVVASLAERRGESLRFEFLIDELSAGDRQLPTPGRVRLSWRAAAQPVRLGERWRLQVRLKPPRGLANPGGFDYEAWLFRAGIAATGYVAESPDNARLSAPAGIWRLAALRQGLHDRISAMDPEARASAVLAALAVGARGGFDAELWELFRRTGTTHLMSISGLHVSMVSGLVYGAVAWAWRRAGPLAIRLPAQHAGAWAAVAAALGYSALAGFSVPTQRSLLMGAVALGAVLLRRAQRPPLVLAIALLAVLLADPVAVLAVDFWLSFGAVAVILLVALGRGPRTWRDRLRAWVRVQLAITFALAPVTLLLFQQVSLVSPLANAWAIPWFGLVVVPVALLATAVVALAPAAGGVALVPAAWLAELGLRGLDAMAALPLAELHTATPPWAAVLAALLGSVVLALPRGVPGRAMGLVLYLPLLWHQPAGVPPGHLRLTLLDVGQGMAAVLRTHRHTLVYDLGPRLSAQFDATSGVVIPYLHHIGARRVDAVVLSNGDADHAGVPAALLRALPVAAAYSGEPARIGGLGSRHCHEGQGWAWDGVEIHFLNPKDPALQGNDASCVLQLRTGEASLLLTGDIGASVERRLVSRFGDGLRATIVQIPHHGSKTSSDPRFVSAVRPQLALLSTGWRNRFGFPKPEVVARWREVGSAVHDTQDVGAIEIELGPDGLTDGPHLARPARRGYWHSR